MRTSERIVIDGYDLLAESGRVRFDDVTLCGRTINRGTATVRSYMSRRPWTQLAASTRSSNT